MGLKSSWWNGLGLKRQGLKCPAAYLNPRLLNPRQFDPHCKYIRPDYDGTLAIHRTTYYDRSTYYDRTTMNG